MTPYHYSVVQCRDASVHGEYRNVGLLVLCPAQRKVWLRRGGLKQRAHLLGDDATFVRALLDGLEDEAKLVANAESAAAAHGWLRSRSRPSEGSLRLVEPGVGIASDVGAEVARLRELYLGRPSGQRKSRAEKLRDQLLRAYGLHSAFTPREFASGPATWRFPMVTAADDHPVVLNTFAFTQRRPEGLLDAAFRNAGRATEVRRHHPQVRWLTIAEGPGTPAFARARELMNDAGLDVIPPTGDALQAGLERVGLLRSGLVGAEA